jgi:hypothetical protein
MKNYETNWEFLNEKKKINIIINENKESEQEEEVKLIPNTTERCIIKINFENEIGLKTLKITSNSKTVELYINEMEYLTTLKSTNETNSNLFEIHLENIKKKTNKIIIKVKYTLT